MRQTKQTDQLKSIISSSEEIFYDESRTQLNDSIFNESLTNIPTADDAKSITRSLSRATGANYRRNILSIERIKSVSNEALTNPSNYCVPVDSLTDVECNNNEHLNRTLPSPKHHVVPCFGTTKLEKDDLILIRDYLTKAFKSQNHPLGILNTKISYCFYTSYGCWKVKPLAILSTHAMQEWESISTRIYNIVRRMFPILPENCGNLDE